MPPHNSNELNTTQLDNNQTINLENSLLTPQNALICLTQEGEIALPCSNAKLCNNLDEYLMKSTQNIHKKVKRSKQYLSTFSTEPFAVPLVRNFDKILKKPSDNSVTPGIRVTKRTKPDLFNRLEKSESLLGPLAVLKNRLNSVVKVLIRRRRKVPYISRVIEYKGTLVLYDKHINLYLKNVIESFKFKLNDRLVKRARHRDALLIRGDSVILVH